MIAKLALLNVLKKVNATTAMIFGSYVVLIGASRSVVWSHLGAIPNRRTDRRMDGRISERSDEWTDARVNGRAPKTQGLMGGRADELRERAGGRMDARMDGCTEGWMCSEGGRSSLRVDKRTGGRPHGWTDERGCGGAGGRANERTDGRARRRISGRARGSLEVCSAGGV